MLEVPCILSVSALSDVEEFLLGIAVAGVALANVGEVYVDEVFERAAIDIGNSVCTGVGGPDEDLCFVGCIKSLDDVLPVLTAPSAIAREAASCRAAPVESVSFIFPACVVTFVVFDFPYPVPRAWVQDVLEA